MAIWLFFLVYKSTMIVKAWVIKGDVSKSRASPIYFLSLFGRKNKTVTQILIYFFWQHHLGNEGDTFLIMLPHSRCVKKKNLWCGIEIWSPTRLRPGEKVQSPKASSRYVITRHGRDKLLITELSQHLFMILAAASVILLSESLFSFGIYIPYASAEA